MTCLFFFFSSFSQFSVTLLFLFMFATLKRPRWTRLENRVEPDFCPRKHGQRPMSGNESRPHSDTDLAPRMFGDLGNLFEGLYELSLGDPVLSVALRLLARTCRYLFDRHVRQPSGLLHHEMRVCPRKYELALACHAPGGIAFARFLYRDLDGCTKLQRELAETLVDPEVIAWSLGWYVARLEAPLYCLKVSCRHTQETMLHSVLDDELPPDYVEVPTDWAASTVGKICLAFEGGFLMAGRILQDPVHDHVPTYRQIAMGRDLDVRRFVHWKLTRVVAMRRLHIVLAWLREVAYDMRPGEEMFSLLLATSTVDDFDTLRKQIAGSKIIFSGLPDMRVFHVGRTPVERAYLTEKKLEYMRDMRMPVRLMQSPCLFELFVHASETILPWLLEQAMQHLFTAGLVDLVKVLETAFEVLARPLHIAPEALAPTVRRVTLLLRWIDSRLSVREWVNGMSMHDIVQCMFSRLLGLLMRCHVAFESGASTDPNCVPGAIQLLLSLAEETRNSVNGRKGTCPVLVEANHAPLLTEAGDMPWLRPVYYDASATIWSELATLLSNEALDLNVFVFFLNERPLASHPMQLSVAPPPHVVETIVSGLVSQSHAVADALWNWWQLKEYAHLRTLGAWRRDMVLPAGLEHTKLRKIRAICRDFFDIQVFFE